MSINIIYKPVITEKSLSRAAKGWFTFVVSKDATKPQIKAAINKQFSVTADEVRTVIAKGATRRIGKKRKEVQVSSYKKAFVHLPSGQKIDLFEVTT